MIRVCTCQTCGWNTAKNPWKDYRICSRPEVNNFQDCRQQKLWQSKDDVLQLHEEERQFQEEERIAMKNW